MPLRQIGSITAVWRNPRLVRNVRDARPMHLDGRFVPRFKASKVLKERLAERTPQHWKDPRHQEARQVAATLVDDLDLYHGTKAPQGLSPTMSSEAVRACCAEAFGALWTQVTAAYDGKVDAEVRSQKDHLAEVAITTWAA